MFSIDNEEEEFWFILNRNSEEGAGIEKAGYLEATGKYKSFIGKVCPYAINYSQGSFFINRFVTNKIIFYNIYRENFLN